MLSKPYRSNETVGGPERSGNRTYLYGLGLDEENLKRPFIGIVNSWSQIHPGHVHLRDVAAAVAEGIRIAGGQAFEFNTIGICDQRGNAFRQQYRNMILWHLWDLLTFFRIVSGRFA